MNEIVSTINIIGQINEELLKEVKKEIDKKEAEIRAIKENNDKFVNESDKKEVKPLYVDISSFGGDVYCSLAIYNLLRNLECEVITRVHGFAFSGAFLIFLAGDKRIGSENTYFMYHECTYTMGGLTSAHSKYLNHISDLEKVLDDILINRTKVTRDMIKEKRGDEWYIYSKEALELSIVTELII